MVINTFNFQPEWHRLVGGYETIPHSWPWTVELIFQKKHHCGGVLISEEFVLTAAHCFARSKRPENYKILVGGHELFAGEIHLIKEIHIHPLHHTVKPSSYDIALLRIVPVTDIEESTVATPICLPTILPPSNKMCVVTGWGRLAENGSRSMALREIHVPIIPPFICNDFHHYSGRIHHASMFCAGFSDGRMDACQGDSGGPLVCQNEIKGVWELQGLVSWGIGCAKPGFPGVYTKVINLVPWVSSTMHLSKLKDKTG